MLRAMQQRFASFGQKNFLVDARKEQRAGFGFERFDLGAHRRLSEMDALRGFGEAARLGNRLKGSELPELHKSMSSKLSGLLLTARGVHLRGSSKLEGLPDSPLINISYHYDQNF